MNANILTAISEKLGFKVSDEEGYWDDMLEEEFSNIEYFQVESLGGNIFYYAVVEYKYFIGTRKMYLKIVKDEKINEGLVSDMDTTKPNCSLTNFLKK